jgi:N-hydroxyarylamine O-acetyltransferase
MAWPAAMDLDRYLMRIGYAGPREPGQQALRQLHRAHLFSVPFENLSIHWGEPIVLDEVAHYWKIVESRRGGFCYEQNALFAWALRSMGYRVKLLAASVWSALNPAPGYGPEFSHLLLKVTLQDTWIADVGFGDGFLNPLMLRVGFEQVEGPRAFRIDQDGELFTLLMRRLDGKWIERYRFNLQSRDISEFAEMCQFHQSSPKSPFTQRRICSLARPDGRITLAGDEWIESQLDGTEVRRPVDDEDEARQLLMEQFGIMSPLSSLDRC